MSIRLNRKKLFCISFFLCCVLPACFSWFSVDDTYWRGLSFLELPLLISTSLFALALLFERARYMLPTGIISHLLLTVHMIFALIDFPVLSGTASQRLLSLSLEAVCPMFWVALALHLFHLAIFTTTEIAMQKLTKHSPGVTNSNEFMS